MANTFRIFVSSTFSDLHAERNALQKFVFPRLRELCLQNGCRFQAIDLRWGVSTEAGRDQQTMKICLEEIKRCQRVTPRPNFIVLLGDRYGWCPLPEEIPANEFEQIIKNVSDEDKKVLLRDEDAPNGWYRRDDNAVPPSFCLQPRADKYADHEVWEKVERKLHAILEKAVDDFVEEARAKYTASATEQEIIQGLNSKNASEHVFCFFRQITNQDVIVANLAQPAKAKDFIELDENQSPNKEAYKKLENLKKKLRQKLPKQNVHDYRAQFLGNAEESKPLLTQDHIGSLPVDLDECLKLLDDKNTPKNLCVDVWRQLARGIRKEIEKIESISTVQREKIEHEKFGEERSKIFVGRAGYLEKIAQYVNADDRHPFGLWGKSGTGKSALMANAAKQIRKTNPKNAMVVRFIGATPQSSDIRALIESICHEISDKYVADKTTIPADFNNLVKEFPKRLALATSQKRLVIMLDALDQLSDTENAHNFRWLPDELPENVRLIVSTIPDNYLKILERKLPSKNLIQLEQMPENEGTEVLDLWLLDAGRKITENQRTEVLKKFAANGLPLYLKFGFEEARLWHSYHELKPLALDVKGIITYLFKRLSDESNHGALMVERALGYLAAARYGLTEDELIEVLWLDEEIMEDFYRRSVKSPKVDSLPVVVWSRLYFDLEPYLTERAGADATLLSFYHRQLGEVTAQKYLSGEDKQCTHQHLADYFDGQDYWLEKPEQYRNRVGEFPKSARRSNGRKAAEFAFQIRQSGDFERLEQIHTNLDFLESKTAAGLVFELAKDFTEATKIIPSERPLRRIIRLLEEALRRDIHFIARHREDYPQALFQCLWNSGWWYDCPQAANHYEEKNGPWSRNGAKLYLLLEKWGEQKKKDNIQLSWLRAIRPPTFHLGGAAVAVFNGHTERVNSVAISADGKKVVSSSSDRTIRIWDTESGQELHCLPGDGKRVAISADGNKIFGRVGDTIRIWDTEKGQQLQCLYEDGGSLAISADGKKIVSGSADGSVRIRDTDSGNLLHYLNGQTDKINRVAISADGKKIVSGSAEGIVRIWDTETELEGKSLVKFESEITSLTFSADGKFIITCEAHSILRIWNIKEGKQVALFSQRLKNINSLAVFDDGKHIVIGCDDYRGDDYVSVLDFEKLINRSSFIPKAMLIFDGESPKTSMIIKNFHGHRDIVTSVAASANGKLFVSASSDGTVRLWDGNLLNDDLTLKGHKGEIKDISISKKNNRIVSCCSDRIILWDSKTGELLGSVRSWGSVHSVDISSDGKLIASGDSKDAERIWDAVMMLYVNTFINSLRITLNREVGTSIKSKAELSCFKAQNEEREVTNIAISPDGKRIASFSGDKKLRLWDVENLKEIAVIRPIIRYVDGLRFARDGRRILIKYSYYGIYIQVWDTEIGTIDTFFDGRDFSELIEDFQELTTKEFILRHLPKTLEVFIKDKFNNKIAYYPISLKFEKVEIFPDKTTWAFTEGNHLHIVKLETLGIRDSGLIKSSRLDFEYYKILAQWKALSWWKKIWTKKPEQERWSNANQFGSFNNNPKTPEQHKDSKTSRDAATIDENKTDSTNPNSKIKVFISTPHFSSNANEASKLNIQYQQLLKDWKALSWWKRVKTKKPEPPKGI